MLLSSSPSPSLFLSKSNDTTSYNFSSPTTITIISKLSKPINLSSISQRASMSTNVCRARRRVRYEDAEGEGEGEGEEYGHNKEIALLEMYSQSATKEALLVQALVDKQEVEVLIFRGFSSCLTYGTSPDPSRSVIPERAVIKCIDRIKGPFDPSNVEYLEKDLSWDVFKNRVV
ncbi:hypothetical protein HS088_TW13G00662 [Tripterygium wilfordii]|uniref:DUF7734 domain-containing protein n=1 Tax=Tripterygium wilfordii TaxID=458696 RepID=A0A7J7CUH0_TRIWF|nr:uncharacterized protein LOC120013953 isoform X1 [Tripterygium wilfordii]KAF5737772.1 hypothetical protein HS088_TW13G00662 [Tripterygium wilfordii]